MSQRQRLTPSRPALGASKHPLRIITDIVLALPSVGNSKADAVRIAVASVSLTQKMVED